MSYNRGKKVKNKIETNLKKGKPIQIELLNGVEYNKKHTETFYIPSNEKKSKVDLGDSVKVCDMKYGERFWVHIDDFISDDLMVGIIDNQLVGNQPYSNGDKIYLTKDNIIDVFDEEYERWVKENHPTLLKNGETYDENDNNLKNNDSK